MKNWDITARETLHFYATRKLKKCTRFDITSAAAAAAVTNTAWAENSESNSNHNLIYDNLNVF